ncbi:MAG: alanine/ornithine racemase family PLP-dependent enzyme [Bacillota bacterium]
MSYPKLDIYLDRIKENYFNMKKMCAEKDIKLTAVIKAFSGDDYIFRSLLKIDIDSIADSRLQNIKKIREIGYKGEAVLLRIPMLSELDQLIKYADHTLISEIDICRRLSDRALKKGKTIGVIVMVDLGDRREGIMPDELIHFLKKIKKLKGIYIEGLGTNLGCFSGVLPDVINTKKLIYLKNKAEKELDIKFNRISAGNTATTKLFEENYLFTEINNLRIGEGILLGTDITNQRLLRSMHHYNFRLQAEIIEIKNKPSLPEGDTGRDSSGREKEFEDRGIRRRAIAAVGKQDIDYKGLYPEYPGVEVLGASSDHLILDLTDAEKEFNIGDRVSFKMNYSAVLRAMTSKYVEKNYIEG